MGLAISSLFTLTKRKRKRVFQTEGLLVMNVCMDLMVVVGCYTTDLPNGSCTNINNANDKQASSKQSLERTQKLQKEMSGNILF